MATRPLLQQTTYPWQQIVLSKPVRLVEAWVGTHESTGAIMKGRKVFGGGLRHDLVSNSWHQTPLSLGAWTHSSKDFVLFKVGRLLWMCKWGLGPTFCVTNTELRERKPVRVSVIHDFGLKFNELLPTWAWIVLARITWWALQWSGWPSPPRFSWPSAYISTSGDW